MAEENIIIAIETQLKGVKEDLDTVKGQLSGLQKESIKTNTRFNSINGGVKNFISLAKRAFAVGVIAKYGKEVVKLASDFEKTNVSFRTLTGSAEKAKQVLSDLDKLNAGTPFDQTELNETAKTLLGFGENADTVVETVERIGKVAAATGAPLQNLGLVYGQVQAQGKAFTQDLNQFVNNGVPIFELLSDEIGTSAKNIRTLASQGKITFEVLQGAIENVTDEGGRFSNALIDQSKTLGGIFSTVVSNLKVFGRNLGNFLLPLLKEVGKFFIEVFGQLSGTLDDLGDNEFGIKIAAGFAAIVEAAKEYFRNYAEEVRKFGFRTLVAINTLRVGFATITRDLEGIGKATVALTDAKLKLDEIIKNEDNLDFSSVVDVYRDKLAELRKEQEDVEFTQKKVTDSVNDGGKASKFAEGSLADLQNQLKKLKDELVNFTIAGSQEFRSLTSEIAVFEELIAELVEGPRDFLFLDVFEGEQDLIKIKEITSSVDSLFKSLKNFVDSQDFRLEIAEILGDPEEILEAKIALEKSNFQLAKYNDDLREQARITARIKVLEQELSESRQNNRSKEIEQQRELLQQIAEGAVDGIDAVIERRISLYNRLIEKQREVVQNAKSGSAEQVSIEKDRLNQLLNDRENAIQRQQDLANIEIGINTAIAVSDAIQAALKVFASGGNPITGILQLASAGAAIFGFVNQVRTLAIPSFYTGIENTGSGNADARGGFAAILHPNERVMDAKNNAQTRGLSNKELAEAGRLYKEGKLQNLTLSVQATESLKTNMKDTNRLLEYMIEGQQDIYHRLMNLESSVNINERGLEVIINGAKQKRARQMRNV